MMEGETFSSHGEASTGSESAEFYGGGEADTGCDCPESEGSEVCQTSGEILAPAFESELTPTTVELSEAQEIIEKYHTQSINQILERNGAYMTPENRIRVSEGVGNIQAIPHSPELGRTGGYRFTEGCSSIEVSNVDTVQLERSTMHETNHFASYNQERIVPCPGRNGYIVYNMVGTREASWFHSCETGRNSEYSEQGRGLNEGLTTLYTNHQLGELDPEKELAAWRQQIYGPTTKLCSQLESILGEVPLKEAYYGGDLYGLECKVNALAGDGGYQRLRDCLDRTISADYVERITAMREAQDILARMSEGGHSSD